MAPDCCSGGTWAATAALGLLLALWGLEEIVQPKKMFRFLESQLLFLVSMLWRGAGRRLSESDRILVMRDALYSLPVSLGSYQLSHLPPLSFTFNLPQNVKLS